DFHVTGVQTCALPISHPQHLHGEGEDVTALAAGEALEEVLRRIDGEVRALAPVQWTGPAPGSPGTLQPGVLGDHLDEVGPLPHRSEERRVGKEGGRPR